MNEKNNIEKRLEELGQAIGTSSSIADKVMDRIGTSQARKGESKSTGTIFTLRRFGKLAVAAVLLVLAGYAGGKLAGPAVNVDEFRSALEDSVRSDLAEELRQQWSTDLAASYVQLIEELNQQHRKDLNRFALQTLAASNTATNQLLTELIQSINAAQAQDRQWVLAALDQIESNRLADTTRFKNGLQSLAVLTGDEFERTRQDMVRLLVDNQGNSLVPEK